MLTTLLPVFDRNAQIAVIRRRLANSNIDPKATFKFDATKGRKGRETGLPLVTAEDRKGWPRAAAMPPS
jgi:hypothetical protein